MKKFFFGFCAGFMMAPVAGTVYWWYITRDGRYSRV